MSFLAYIARGFAQVLKERMETIPIIIIRLLERCPPEGAPSRKELLVAVRHILSTDLRIAFVPHIEALMNEQLLLGEGYTAFYIFRPAAYSMLADLIHHVRFELSANVIEKALLLYSRALHDPTLPYGIQTMSVKLLLNLIDVINGGDLPTERRRELLIKVFTTILLKFEWMRKIVAELLAIRRRGNNVSGSGGGAERNFDPFFDDPLKARPILTDNVALDPSRDNIRDLKFQLKTMIGGLKNLVYSLRTIPLPSGSSVASSISNTNNPSSAKSHSALQLVSSGLSMEESERYLIGLFRDGIGCFDLFHFKFPNEKDHPTEEDSSVEASVPSSSQTAYPASSIVPADEKELMDQFAHIFSLFDVAIFNDVVSSNMDMLIEQAKENVALVSIPQYLLSIHGISKACAAILARHLMEHFEEIGSSNSIASAIVLRLFKLLFLAVSVYPEENENILQPYLAEIIMSCFRLYPKASSPSNYFVLLRSLFRSIGGGRFDSLYKEVLPLLQTILEELSSLSPTTNDPLLRDMYVELCLTTPVRLSNLLPHLSYLMRPVVLALQSGGELVNQGLRTFELCLDNLTPDFLEPILAPVFPDILQCLWRMLRPPPANQVHAHTAVRLLGKLGGKSRRYLTNTPNYGVSSSKKSVGVGLMMQFAFETKSPAHGNGIKVPCDAVARTAMMIINNSHSVQQPEAKYAAFLFLKRSISSILAFFGFEECLELFVERLALLGSAPSVSEAVKRLLALNTPGEKKMLEACHAMAFGLNVHKLVSADEKDSVYCWVSPDASKQLLCEIICALIDAYGVHADDYGIKMRQEIASLLISLYQFVTLLFITRLEHRIINCIDYEVICDIIVEYATSSNEAQMTLTWDLIRSIHEQYTACALERDMQYEIKAFFLLTDKVISACFRPNLQQRVAACRLIARLCDLELNVRFFWHHEIRLIRGVLYVMKSLPAGICGKYNEELTSVVFKVLRLANRLDECGEGGSTSEEFLNQRRQYFDQVVLALVTELSNPNETVRDAVKASFQLLSNIQGCEVTDILLPLKARVCGPIFSKPLRALPVHVQVGYIDAITYCLSLRPPLLEINEELLRLVNESIIVVENEDQPPAPQQPQHQSQVQQSQQQNSSSSQLQSKLNIQSLKIVCIRLLSTCLASAEFQQQTQLQQLRNQIVAVFFKTLYARQAELVEVSRSALEQVMGQQQRLPTELLQNGLRPVLQSLGEPQKLTAAGVEGLRRVLRLFSHFFRAEIGRKLLDHLHSWADLMGGSSGVGGGNTEGVSNNPPPAAGGTNVPSGGPAPGDSKVITAIMELFCLLPNCGSMFMGELVHTVLQLEIVFKRRASSPFRPVLLKFMELYPVEAVNFLAENMTAEPIVNLYAALTAPSFPAVKVTAEMGRCFDSSFKRFFSNVPESASNISIKRAYATLLKNYYLRCATMIKAPPHIEEHVAIIKGLWAYLDKIKCEGDYITPSTTMNQVAKLVFDSSLIFLSAHPSQIDCAFILLNAFVLPFVLDTIELPAFYRSWLRRCPPDRLRAMMLYWLKMHGETGTKFFIKARAARLLVLPMIAELSKLSDADFSMIMDEEMFKEIEQVIWHRDCRSCCNGSCVIAVEELQFTLSIMQIMRMRWNERLQNYQERIFPFLFNRVQSLDCSVKYSALYVLAVCLIESPSGANDQLLRVLTSLLKAPTADIRSILRQSFELLVPYIVKQTDTAFRKRAVELIAASLTREKFLLIMVLSLWQSIHQHEKALTSLACSLIGPLINSFAQCAHMAFSSVDGRQVPFELVTTLLYWHKNIPNSISPFAKQPYLVDILLNGLIRLLLAMPTSDYSEHGSGIFERGLRLLTELLETFYNGSFYLKLSGLERLLVADPTDESNHAMVACGMKVLAICISCRGDNLVPAELIQYENFLRSLLENLSTHERLLAGLKKVFGVIFEKIRNELDMLPSPVEDLRDMLVMQISEYLGAGRNLSACFFVLNAPFSYVLPLESLIPMYLRCFSRIVKEHLSHQQESSSEVRQADAFNVSNLVIPGIEFGLKHLDETDFARAPFLSLLHSLWEHSSATDVLKILVGTMLQWIKSNELIPTLREKVEFMLVPCKIEQMQQPTLLGVYLDIVYEIYSRPIYARTELRCRLEGAFLRGLRSPVAERRERFACLLDASIPRNLSSRLRHVFETQRWDLAGSTYWIPLAVDVILRAARGSNLSINFIAKSSREFTGVNCVSALSSNLGKTAPYTSKYGLFISF